MKKVLLITLVCFFMCSNGFSNEVHLNRAMNVAKNYLLINHDKSLDALEHAKTIFHEDQALCYFLNFPDENGYIVVAAYDQVEPVLAYSFAHAYDDDMEKPPQYVSWMNNYYDQIRYVIENDLRADDAIVNRWILYSDDTEDFDRTVKSVSPLLTTTWGQGCFYNGMCPVDPDGPCGRTLAGCVAIAMAQIMKYHNWPATGNGSHSYNHADYGWQFANFGATTYNWTDMPNALNAANTSVARLIYHCGVSVEMDYGPDGSGAVSADAAPAFINHFRYDSGTTYYSKSTFTNSVWLSLLRGNLNGGLPVYYRGQSSGSGGHAWVVDGYQGTNHFHMNWGWYGNHNGYFYLTSLNPGTNDFNDSQAAILFIRPASVDPCTQIVSLGAGGAENSITYASQGTGLWTTNACGYDCHGKERIYSFTAPHTGIYSLQVTESNNTFVDYFWKSGTCSSSGWNCIGWFYGPATKGNMNWTGGTTYYILADAESTNFSMQTFHINIPEPPGTWLGTASSNWHHSANWSAGIIPNSSVDVTIPSGTPHSPAILSGDANCKSLTINSGATLSIYNKTLTIDGNLTVNGTIGMHQNDGKINILGNTAWNSGSSLNVTASLTFINAYGNWNFNAGAAVNPAMGFVDLRGSSNSWIRCYSSNSSFYNLRIYKTGDASANFSWLGGEDLVVNGLLFISSTGVFESHSNNNMILKGNFNYYGTFDFTKNINTGSVVFAGSSQSVNNYNSGSGVFNNVVFNSSTGTNIINGDLTIAGNLTIDQGYLSSGSNTIYIEGNWTNNNFPAGFNADTGRVIFNGTGHQYVYSSENFNILEANMGAALRINHSSRVVTCNQYHWTAGGIDVIAGTFTANDLAQNGLYGGFWVNPGGTINLTNSTGTTWVDLVGSIYNFGGTINISGSIAWWPYADGAHLTMTGGVIDLKTSGLRIHSGPTWSYNITGGTIRTAHHYTGNRTDFSPTAGTFEFYGSSNTTISQNAGNTLHRVVINKEAARDGEEGSDIPLYDERSGELLSDGGRSGAISLNSDFLITNDLVVESGALNIGGHELTVSRKADIYGTLNMNNAGGVLNVGTAQFDNLRFYNGSTANLLNGNMYLKSWFVVEEGASFLASTDNTIHIIGGNLGGGLANYEPTALFGNVKINKTANPAFFSSISTGPYNIQGDFTIHSGNTFHAGTKPCKVSGSFNDHATSSLLLFYPKKKGENDVSSEQKKSDGFYRSKEKSGTFEIDNYFTIKGLMDVDAGSVLCHGGFQIAETGTLNITSGSFIMDAGYYKSAKAWQDIYGTLNLGSGLFEIAHNSINFRPTAVTNITGGIIRCGFTFSVETPGIFTPTGGVVEFASSGTNPFIRSVAGNWFNNLKINRSDKIVLRTDIEVKGNVEIISGPFSTYGVLGQFDMLVGGNWTNTGGASAFDPGTGRVTFNGATDQTCSAETFHILELNKPGGHVIIPDTTTCNTYDWKAGGITVNGGSFTANGLQQGVISGSYILNDNGVINLHQGVNNYVDLNADITINSGTLNIYGGPPGSTSWWPSSDASLTMSGGVLDIKDQTIYVRDAGTFISNITGGTIRTSKGYIGERTDFNPAAGTFEFYGPDNAFISQDNGSTLHNVLINKPSDGKDNPSKQEITHSTRDKLLLTDGGRSGNISLDSDFTVTNNFQINSGTFNITDHPCTVLGNATINNGGALEMEGYGSLAMGSGKALTVNNGGELKIFGDAVNLAKITRHAGRYALNVEAGGTIGAENAIFEYMDINGVNIKPGAIVDINRSFTSCIFRHGHSSGRLLTLNNEQSLTISNASFPTTTGNHNVSKNYNTGVVTFLNYGGAFSGSGFEQDPYNRLHWTDQLSPLVNLNGIVISPWQDMCFEAEETITVGGVAPFDAMPNSNVKLVAGNSIIFLPGTHAHHGSNLHAWISENGYCSSLPPAPVATQEETELPEPITREVPGKEQFFKVYPNPTGGDFTIEIAGFDESETVMVQIFSMQGNIIISQELPAQRLYTLSLAGKKPGIYLVRVIMDDQMGVARLVKKF